MVIVHLVVYIKKYILIYVIDNLDFVSLTNLFSTPYHWIKKNNLSAIYS